MYDYFPLKREVLLVLELRGFLHDSAERDLRTPFVQVSTKWRNGTRQRRAARSAARVVGRLLELTFASYQLGGRKLPLAVQEPSQAEGAALAGKAYGYAELETSIDPSLPTWFL